MIKAGYHCSWRLRPHHALTSENTITAGYVSFQQFPGLGAVLAVSHRGGEGKLGYFARRPPVLSRRPARPSPDVRFANRPSDQAGLVSSCISVWLFTWYQPCMNNDYLAHRSGHATSRDRSISMQARHRHALPSWWRRVRRAIAYVRWSLRSSAASKQASTTSGRRSLPACALIPMCYHVE